MKRIRIIIMLLVLLMLNGCGNEANDPFSESKAPPDIAAMEQEKDPGMVRWKNSVCGMIILKQRIRSSPVKQ